MKTLSQPGLTHPPGAVGGVWKVPPIHALGLAGALVYGGLAWFSVHPQLLSPAVFYGLLGCGFVLSVLAFRFARAVSPLQLLCWAAVFRLIGCMGEPLLEDDFYRYLWDGYRFFQTGSPYGLAPAAFFGDGTLPQGFINVLAQINYPQIPTIYGPTLEYSFLLAHLIAPAQVWPLQLLYSLLDLALVALLLRMAAVRWVLLYAWSPLVIKELAFTAHPDGVGVFLLVLALFWRQRHFFAGAAVALALSVGAKVFAWLLVPFVLWRMPSRYWAVFVLALAGLYLPFLLQGGSGSGSDLAGLQVFVQRWQFNGSLFPLLSQWFEPIAVKVFLAALFLAVYGSLFWRHCRGEWQMPRGDWLFGAFFLVAPVVNAWYLLWLLPFAVLYPRYWSWTASVAVLLSYLVGINFNSVGALPLLGLPGWVILTEYSAVAAAVLFDLWRARRQHLPHH